MKRRVRETSAPFDFGGMLRLGREDGTLTGLRLTLLKPLELQSRRILKFGRKPRLSLGVQSAAAWLLGN